MLDHMCMFLENICRFPFNILSNFLPSFYSTQKIHTDKYIGWRNEEQKKFLLRNETEKLL